MAIADRFWSKVLRTDGCWEWMGRRGQQGYGQLQVDLRQKRAHRVSWELAYGSIGAGLCVLHRCDNTGCVNPAHLFLGTRSDNNADRDEKGRSARGQRHGTHTHPGLWRGERNGHARLTTDQVRAIRHRRSQGETQVALADSFGISRRALRAVLTGESWGWLS